MTLASNGRDLAGQSPAGTGMDLPERQSIRTIQSVERALTILELVAGERIGLSLSEMAERSGLNTSTCHHLAATLVARGYLAQNGRSRGYVLGNRLNELHEMVQGELDPAILLRDRIEALGKRLGHGVQMAVMSDNTLLTKLSFPDPHGRVKEADEILKMGASHATATGKAILAWLPDTELVRIISANGLNKYTPRTITSLSGLVEELRLVRRNKYAIDDEEFCDGIVCIGASIRDGSGGVVGAISMTIPKTEDTKDYREAMIKELIMAGHDLSRMLEAEHR